MYRLAGPTLGVQKAIAEILAQNRGEPQLESASQLRTRTFWILVRATATALKLQRKLALR
jgi:hypothetical protein